jgi:hypothetical protein
MSSIRAELITERREERKEIEPEKTGFWAEDFTDEELDEAYRLIHGDPVLADVGLRIAAHILRKARQEAQADGGETATS